MTPEQLAKIRARVDAATDGPWRKEEEPHEFGFDCGYVVLAPNKDDVQIAVASYVSIEDAEFFVHARADIPALLDEVERLQERNNELEALSGFCSGSCGHPDSFKYGKASIAELEAAVGRLQKCCFALASDLQDTFVGIDDDPTAWLGQPSIAEFRELCENPTVQDADKVNMEIKAKWAQVVAHAALKGGEW